MSREVLRQRDPQRFERIQAQLSDISAVVQEALAGVRVVRAYGQERPRSSGSAQANQEYVDRNRVLIRLQGLFYPSMTLLSRVRALCSCCGSAAARSFAGRITLGEFVAFNAYLVMLSWPMIAFGWVTNILQRGMASWKRMLEVLDARAGDRRCGRARRGARPRVRGRIEFRDLTLRLRRPTPVLDGVSLRIEAGPDVAIVGATGSGKSTLISLLPRLHEPPPGTVFVDGVDVREIPLAALRGAIGFVPQEPFLFSDTIAENIAFGVDAPAIRTADAGTRCAAAAAVARLDKDVEEFPQGLRHGGRRARHHAVGRPEAAHRARPRADARSAHPDPGRCAVGGGYVHGRGDPVAAARRDAPAHVDHRLAPRLDRPRRGSDLSCSSAAASSSADARRARRARRHLRRAVSTKQLLEEEARGRPESADPALSMSRMHEEEVLGKAYDARLMRRLLRLSAAVHAVRWCSRWRRSSAPRCCSWRSRI